MSYNTIFTAGYGNLSVSTFVQQLHQYDVTTLIDIRSRPYSRFQPKFNITKFPDILSIEGISYIFKGDTLGGRPANKMLYTGNKLNYNLVAATKEYQTAIDEVLALSHSGENVCLMCCELNPDVCHRQTLVGNSMIKRGVAVKHILPYGGLQTQFDNSPIFLLF